MMRLRAVKRWRVDHRDIVVGASDRAIAASDTHVVLEVDLTLWTPLNRARWATVHAARIVTMAAGAGHQILADLNAIANEAALAMQRLASLDAIVTFDGRARGPLPAAHQPGACRVDRCAGAVRTTRV